MSDSFLGSNKAQSLRNMTRTYGVDIAKVTNVKDPDNKNRVKCKLVSSDKTIGETNWAIVSSFMSGADKGAVFFPSVGDMVLLAYIGGDIHRPVVIGSIWTQETARPRSYGSNGENDIRSIKTASGAEIVIDDTKSKEKITVTTKAGTTLTLDDGGNSIMLQNKSGNNGIVINTKNGEMTIKAEKKIMLQAGSTKWTLDGTANKITGNANSAIELKAATLKANASGKMELSTSGAMTVKSSGVTTVKGSLVKLD